VTARRAAQASGAAPASGAARYAGRKVLVAGAGVSGVPVAQALLAAGADVTVTDRRDSDALTGLAAAGARVLIGAEDPPAGTADVVTSPGWRPDHPLLVSARC
jgi:UDP-N-acetylmuramoylalanine--D-glutamate ligase